MSHVHKLYAHRHTDRPIHINTERYTDTHEYKLPTRQTDTENNVLTAVVVSNRSTRMK